MNWKHYRGAIADGSMPVPGISCLMWIRSYGSHLYGAIRVGPSVMTAPQVAFNAWNDEPLRIGEEVRHTCDWRPCCNHEHLLRGTKLMNMADMKHRGRQPCRKLEPCDVIAIRESYARGETPTDLAARFGIVRQNVHQIVKRRAWKHI